MGSPDGRRQPMPTRNMAHHWRREARIMDFCANHAREIIAELHTSGGDHHEDVLELSGLIEVWEHLRDVADEALLNEEHRTKRGDRP